MAVTVSELQVVVTADTSKAESGLASFGAHVGSIGSTVATAFGAAAVGGVVALGAALGASVNAAANFEQAMSGIAAVSGATSSEMEQMSALALQLGADTSFSATEAAAGIGELIKAGVSVSDVLGGGAAAALNLAAAGGLSVAESASIASNAMNVFSLSGADVGHVADVIAGAANASAIDVHDFGMSLAAVGSVAATVGIGFDDLGSAIAVMGQAGIKGSDAGTSLKTMLLNLTPSSKAATAEMRQLGIITADGSNQFFDATGKAKSLAEISGVLQTATKDLTEQQKLQALQTMFGTDAIRAAAIMAKAGSDGFNTMAESIGKVTAADVAKVRLDNLRGSLEQLSGSLETAGITLGTMLLPGLKKMVDGLTAGVNDGIAILQRLPAAAADVASMFSDGVTAGNLEQMLADMGLSAATVAKVDGWLQDLGDAWRTMQQAFAGDWRPSAQVTPFVDAVGKATLTVRELMTEVGRLGDELGGLSGAVSNLTATFGEGRGLMTLLLADFKLTVLTVAEMVDVFLSAARAAVDFAGVTVALGRAIAALASGDIPAATAAIHSGDAAMADLGQTAEELGSRTLGRLSAGFQTVADAAGVGMNATSQAVEGGMADATAAVETGSAAMESAAASGMTGVSSAVETGMAESQAATDAGMTAVVGSIEAAAPAAAAAGTALGAGAADGISSAAPAMAAAAQTGADGAIAAVEGQAGAAAGAGASVGDSLGSGMMAGIQSWVGSVASAAANLVSAAIGAARAEADAQSPSKKTEQLGQDLAAGLEKGLASASIGDDMVAQIRDFVAASREYIPTAGEIKRVESEIAAIRQRSQTDALFRAEQMIDVNSEVLRLTQAQVALERDLVPVRQDLARATREVSDIERGSLADRQSLIEMDGQRQQLRLQEIDLEKQLIGLDRDSKRSKTIQDQIDKLRDQDQALQLEQDRIRTTNSLAATAAKSRREGLDDTARGQQTVVDRIKDQIDVLNAEQSVFSANENVIKNATDNEVAYRERLIAVFKSEATPLTDRIAAGLKLVDQLEKEGSISKELADQLRSVAREAGASEAATSSLGAAAATAAPRLGEAASQAGSLADAGNDVADNVGDAARSVDALSKSLGKLPDWFHPTSRQMDSLFGGGRAGGGPVAPGTSYLVGERGPELFSPPSAGTIVPLAPSGRGSSAPVETHRIELVIGGQAAAELYVTGRETAIRYGRVAGTTG